MKKNKNDLRIRITKKLIRESLTKLLLEKKLQKISIANLCENAGINRSTFYSHYSDIYDLMEEIEDEMMAEFLDTLRDVEFSKIYSDNETLIATYVQIFEFLKRNSDMCIFLISENSDRKLVKTLFQTAKKKTVEEYKKMYPDATYKKLEMLYAFIASGCIGLLELWINNGMKESSEEMAEITNSIMLNGVNYLNN